MAIDEWLHARPQSNLSRSSAQFLVILLHAPIRPIQIVVVRFPACGYIKPAVAILLSFVTAKFDLGSGTPTPHTSTTPAGQGTRLVV